MTTNLEPCLSSNGHVLRETERLAAAMRVVGDCQLSVSSHRRAADNELEWWVISYRHPYGGGGRGDSPAAAVEDWLRRNPQPEAAP